MSTSTFELLGEHFLGNDRYHLPDLTEASRLVTDDIQNDGFPFAAVTAAAFEKKLHGTEFNLTGTDALDHARVAGILSEVSGKLVRYHALTEEAMLQGARDQSIPEIAANDMAMLYQVVRNGWAAAITEDVKTV